MEAQSFELLAEGDMVSKYRYLSNVDYTWGAHLLLQLVSDRAKILKSPILEPILFLSIHTASINFQKYFL